MSARDGATRVVRRGAGTSLLLIHGAFVDHRLMLALDEAFADPQTAGGPWERLYIDLPGSGGTPALDAPGGLPEIADWLDNFVEETIGDQPFAVVGCSLGGALACDLTARRSGQVLGLALLVPVVDPIRENRVLPDPAVLQRDEALIASLDPSDAELYEEMAVVQSSDNWERFREAVLPGIRAMDQVAAERMGERYFLDPVPRDRLASSGYDRPALIVTGRQDAVVGYRDQEALVELLPQATHALLDRAGHNIACDQPDLVSALLREWASRTRAAAR